MGGVREFSTQWGRSEARIWHEWEREDLIGTVVQGGRGMPVIGLYDFFTGRSVGLMGSILLYSNSQLRFWAQNPAGPDPYFVRFGDFDALYCQYSGTSKFETEYGVIELAPSHTVRIPAGVAHRSIGSADCRRLLIMSYEPIQANYTADAHQTHRHISVQASGGIEWNGPAVLPGDGETIREAVWRWDSSWSDPMWIQRSYHRLSGGSTEGIPMEVLRSFDFFQGMTGKGVRGPGPMPYRNGNLHMEVYNTEGEQFGFHRGHGQDELWCQFGGHAINETEHGIIELDPGLATIVPPGISHRIIGGQGFLRWVFYSRLPLTRHVDPQQQITHTHFEIRETE